MPTTFSSLLVELASGAAGTEAAFTVRLPGAETTEEFKTDTIVLPSEVPPLQTDADLTSYSEALSTAVFGGTNGSSALARARAAADVLNLPLRVRVSVGDDAALARHHWELLADPRGDFKPFAWGERSWFARYVRAPNPRAPALTSGGVRTIALLANPTDLAQMDRIEADAERAVISEALGRTQIRRLVTPRATFESLKRELREGADVVVLTLHGRLNNGRACLYFEREGQQAHVVAATELADHIGQVPTPPRLVVLVSCDSAGTGDTTFRDDGGFFSSAAVALLKAGVPAVVGMQGAVARDTGRTFIKAFFESLLSDGHVEKATAAARMAIPRQADWWVASLVIAVDDGLLWAGGPPRPFLHWDAVLDALDLDECTAILGSEVIERLSNRNLANYFAGQSRRKPQPGTQADLARISQQLRLEIGRERLKTSLKTFYSSIQREDGIKTPDRDLPRSVSAWAREMLPDRELNPYLDLAGLRIALYLTTNPDDLLADALRAAGKTPQILFCPWRNDNPGQLEPATVTPPTVDTPVVYHLFGHLSDTNSVVLTEDDFFDHLIWVARHSARTIPQAIPVQLASTSLLFLGFQLADWEFRLLLRGLMRMPMVRMLAERIHVAVQLDPRELTQEEQEKAVAGLEEHFKGTDVKLEIYWGTVEMFLAELRRQRDKRASETAARVGAS
jgi:hypothetical protein